MTYLTLDELRLRDEERLPRKDDGTINVERCEAVLVDAAGIVRTYLPSLIGADGRPVDPPPRLAESLKPIVRDIVLYQLNDRPGEEVAQARYDRAIRLLKELAGGGGNGTSGGEIEPIDDDEATVVPGYSEFLPPTGRGL